MVKEEWKEISFKEFEERYRPVSEELLGGEKRVRFWDIDDPVVSNTPRDHLWSYVENNGDCYIVPGLAQFVQSYIITNEPWNINDSGVIVRIG